MMKRTFILILTALVGITVFSQSVEEQKKKIAAIKKSSSYIYAEVTTTSQQQAIDLATDMLHNNVNEWAAKKKKFAGSSKIVTTNTNYSIEQITMPRANMYRAFMYVKKSDIIPADNVEVRDTPVEVSTAKDSKPKEAKVTPISNSNRDYVVSQLLPVKNTGQLSAKLKDLRASGKIVEYDNLRGLKGKNMAEYIMVVFNKEGNVEAILSEGENRVNLLTSAPDQLTNYKGRGAIGVKVKM
ncbi:MAG: hypothetical protein ILA25_02950 [Prevotella sp.]|nr:hypothetical protein [Prevotella sp.]